MLERHTDFFFSKGKMNEAREKERKKKKNKEGKTGRQGKRDKKRKILEWYFIKDLFVINVKMQCSPITQIEM